jgi:hypothetical protein
MKQREEKVPAAGKPRSQEVHARLVQLYKETNRPERAAALEKDQPSKYRAALPSISASPPQIWQDLRPFSSFGKCAGIFHVPFFRRFPL